MTVSATCSVEEGIKNFRSFIGKDGNGHRRYRVHPRCRYFRWQMASYRYNPVTGVAVKAFDDGPDAGRYGAWIRRHA